MAHMNLMNIHQDRFQ